MNREIKFKAYLKKIHKIVEVSEINFRKGWIEYYDYETQEYVDYKCEDTDDLLESDEIVIMQYIGLKDKNGKKIYEGDIVRKKCNYLNTGETKIRLYKVVWKEEWCAWALKKLGNCTQSCYMYKNELELCEIVGNICENPELLEVK